MNTKQNSRLHGLLASLGLTEEKENIISEFTEGRTKSSRDLSEEEADALIEKLEADEGQRADHMRKTIISRAYEIGWGNNRTREAIKDTVAKINEWCNTHSYLHKPLNSYTLKELPKLVTQFKQIPKGN